MRARFITRDNKTAMPLIRPFAALRPVPERVAEVIAPPYDVLSSAEARERATGRPWSFLHISKPEIDLPEGTAPHDPAVYAKGAENFSRMLEAGVLRSDPAPYYYFYRLVMGGHAQTGLVAAAAVAAYQANRIRRHELTQPDKEDDRVRQIDALNAQTGPVFLTYRHVEGVDTLAARVIARPPEVDIVAEDGVRHSLWVVREPATIAALTDMFDRMDCLYIADGHHRSAAAARVARQRRAANHRHTGNEPYDYFLAVIFPENQLQILDYNRVVRDLNGLSRAEFLHRVGNAFAVVSRGAAVKPERSGRFGMYLPGQWYQLTLRPECIPAHDPVGRLDVSLLESNLIVPVLGVTDPRRDPRIDFVGGIRGLAELQNRVDSGEMAVAFTLHPPALEELMAVADNGAMMPPKSTWFEPKLADGLVTHVLDLIDR